jgi:hypothetical protein
MTRRHKNIRHGSEDTDRTNVKSLQKPKHDRLNVLNQDSTTDVLAGLTVEQHAALLANAHSDKQRANLVINLQQKYGNRYIQRLLNSKIVQAKLTVNAPGDIYEQEADRIANAVTRKTNTTVKRQEEEIQAQRQEEEEEEEIQAQRQEEEEEEEIQVKAVDNKPLVVRRNLERQINTARSNGQPMSEEVRQPMEQAFGADFSGVRVHTDSEAHELSESLQARAFTTGQDIFFKDGEYSPRSSSGQHLLAHELTHTVQQGASNRIARWGPKGHELLTRDVLATVKGKPFFNRVKFKIADKVIDFVATRAGDLDATGRSFLNFAVNIPRSIFRRILFKLSLPDVAKKMWEENWFHVRNPAELRVHGEAGGYKEEGKSAENRAGASEYIKKAAEAFAGGSPHEALTQLAYGLHSAEDRGAHGEGEPGKGHDPRIQKIKRIPYKGKWVKNPYYNPAWDPDDRTSNAPGWDLGRAYAIEALFDFCHIAYALTSDPWPLSQFGLTPEESKQREGNRIALSFLKKFKLKDKEVDELLKRQRHLKRKGSKLTDNEQVEFDSVENLLKAKAKVKAEELEKAWPGDKSTMPTERLYEGLLEDEELRKKYPDWVSKLVEQLLQ